MLIGEILKELFAIEEEDIQRALTIQREKGGYLGQILISLGVITERQLLKALSVQLKIPLLEEVEDSLDLSSLFDPQSPLREELNKLNLSFLLENNFIPLSLDNNEVIIATNDPLKSYILDYISRVLGYRCRLLLADEKRLRELRRALSTEWETGYTSLLHIDERIKDLAHEAPIVKYLNDLLSKALEANASDIHLEPSPNYRVRLRIDGILQDYDYLKEDFYLALVSRVKLLSGLDIAERRLPQDGKFSTKIGATFLDLRVSTMPTVLGEDVVIRLLKRGKLSFHLSDLGLEEDHYLELSRLIRNPHGILLVTGPTGSGKTTTLYSILTTIKSPTIKIITVEDPVEYQLEGLTQVQVKPEIGLTFAQALRSILRHDPDVIMIGEIRDTETAQIALQASLTGHLVLSTLHTNDTLSSIFRLLDMGIERYLINASLIGILAQRLVRVICPHCAEELPLKEEILSEIERSGLSEKFKSLVSNPRLRRGRGCKACFQTGYRGRIAIFELLVYDEEVKELVTKQASLTELRKLVRNKGSFRTLREDGLIKVLKGITTLEEVLRVSRDSL